MDRIPPILLALVCVLAWSFIPIVSRIGQADIDGLQFLFWTNFLSTLSVGFVTKNLRIKLAKEFDVIKCSQTMYLGFLGCFLYYLCIYHGYAKGDSVEVLVVQYLWPPMISIFAVFILKERLNARRIISLMLGFMAAVVVLTKGDVFSLDYSNVSAADSSALVVTLVGAISFSLFSVFSKLERRQDVSLSVFMYFLWATMFSLITLILWGGLAVPDLASMPVVLINGVFINGLSYILWIHALSREDASKIAPLVYISPVLSVVWISLVFNENITFMNFIAISLVIISGMLVTAKQT